MSAPKYRLRSSFSGGVNYIGYDRHRWPQLTSDAASAAILDEATARDLLARYGGLYGLRAEVVS